MNAPLMCHVKLVKPQTYRGRTHQPGAVLHVTRAIAAAWGLRGEAKILTDQEARSHRADIHRRSMAEREEARRMLGYEDETASHPARPRRATRPM